MRFVVISASYGDVEQRLLDLNINRIVSILSFCEIVYVINSREEVSSIPHDPRVTVLTTTTSPFGSDCAAANRLAGLNFFLEKSDLKSGEIIVFLDGDMAITRPYLSYLSEIEAVGQDIPSLICCDRMDLRYDLGTKDLLKKRVVGPKQRPDGSFRTIYGAFAIRNIGPEMMILTYDHEEQWFLTLCRAAYSSQITYKKFPRVGILHFDKWHGYSRLLRIFFGPRGVGFWQGLFSFQYGLGGVFTVFRDQGHLLLIAVLPIVIGFVSPWLIIVLIFLPKVSKRLIWLYLGLAKIPFYRRARTVEVRKI